MTNETAASARTYLGVASGGSTNITDSGTNLLVKGRVLADSTTLTNGLTLGSTAVTASGAELNF